MKLASTLGVFDTFVNRTGPPKWETFTMKRSVVGFLRYLAPNL